MQVSDFSTVSGREIVIIVTQEEVERLNLGVEIDTSFKGIVIHLKKAA